MITTSYNTWIDTLGRLVWVQLHWTINGRGVIDPERKPFKSMGPPDQSKMKMMMVGPNCVWKCDSQVDSGSLYFTAWTLPIEGEMLFTRSFDSMDPRPGDTLTLDEWSVNFD